MKSNFLALSWTEIRSAMVYAMLTAVLAILVHIVGVGDIFALSGKVIANIGVMALCVGMISIIKNLLTTSEGKFLGAVKVKEEDK